jgi:hypothetical protein
VGWFEYIPIEFATDLTMQVGSWCRMCGFVSTV